MDYAAQTDVVSMQKHLDDTASIRIQRNWLVTLAAILIIAAAVLSAALVRNEQDAARYRVALQAARVRSDDLLTFMLSELRDQVAALGRLDILEQAARKGLAYAESLPDAADAPEILGRRGVALDNIGEILMLKGDARGAETAYRAALEIAEGLVRRDPENAQWQHDLALGREKLGDLSAERGNRPEALAAYQNALELLDRVTEQHPENPAWQYDLAIGHERLGNSLSEKGDWVPALEHYLSRRTIISRLATLNPKNPAWQQDLALSYGAVGDVHLAQRDYPAALVAYQQCREISAHAFSGATHDAPSERNMAVCLQKSGDVKVAQGDLPSASAAYRKAQELIQRLLGSDPENALWKRDAAVGHVRLAAVLVAQGKLEEAIVEQRHATRMLAQLADGMQSPKSRAEAAQAWEQLAWCHLLHRQHDAAAEAARQGLKTDPSRMGLRVKLAHGLLLSGHYVEAEAIYRENRTMMLEDGRRFGEAVLEDFARLWAKGVAHPDMVRIEKSFRPEG